MEGIAAHLFQMRDIIADHVREHMAVFRLAGQKIGDAHILVPRSIVNIGLQLGPSLFESIQQSLPGQIGHGGLRGIAALQRLAKRPLHHGVKGARHVKTQYFCKINAVSGHDLFFDHASGNIEFVSIQRISGQRFYKPVFLHFLTHNKPLP